MKKNFKHLVLGAKYKNRVGSERGPLIKNDNSTYPFKCSMMGSTYTETGHCHLRGESPYDLVELVSLPETQTPKRKVTDLGPNEAIHCATEAEDKAIRELLHAAGKKWIDGDSYLDFTHWPNYDCHFPACGQADTRLYCKKRGYTIYPASDFLSEATPAAEFGSIPAAATELDYNYEKRVREYFGTPEDEDISNDLPDKADFEQIVLHDQHCGEVPPTAFIPCQDDKKNAPYWMVRLEGSGEPTFRHTTQESAIQEAHRLLATLTGYSKATITMHYPVTKVATVTVKRLTETEYVNEADYRPENDYPF